MANTYDYDNNDCYSAEEFYNAYPAQGLRFVYMKVKYTRTEEGYIGDAERHYYKEKIRNTSYYMPCDWNDSFWTDDINDYIEDGYWLKRNHHVEPSSPSDDIILAFTTRLKGFAYKCSSSVGSGNISVSQDYWYDDCIISFVGRFLRIRNSDGEVQYLISEGVGNVYKMDNQYNITTRWVNTDNGGSGVGQDTKIKQDYSIETVLLDLRENSEVPYIFDVMMPTTHAWKPDEDIEWTEGKPNLLPEQAPYNFQNRALGSWYMDDNNKVNSGLLPQTLEWGKPYPYGKWYRDTDGTLKNCGLPDTLIDYQGAFNKCTNLVEVTIPETVKSIGRYSFRETNLKSVKIARDCTYYDTSFPSDCRIYFYGGGTITTNSIADMESRQIERLATMTINELEGN